MSRVLCVFVFGLIFSETKADTPFYIGSFEGSGRACYGELKVTRKNLTWKTPFSKCPSQKYTVSEELNEKGTRTVALVGKNPTKTCLYSVFVLSHKETENQDTGWNINGYKSIEDYKRSSADSISCYLYRK